jgi:hypothetical protein
MKNLLIALSLTAGVVLSACKKETIVDPPVTPTCTLNKITNPDGSYSVFTRNAAGKYTAVKNYPPSGTFSSWRQYEYSGDMLAKLTYYKGSSEVLQYNTYEKTSYGQLVHQWVPAGGLFQEQGQMEYHMSGTRITKVVSKANSQGSFVAVKQDDYTFDASGNVTKIVSNDMQQGTTTTSNITYDAKPSPYAGDFNPGAATQSRNNITKIETSGVTSEYTYTYNTTGYPITRNTKGNGMSTYKFEYTGCN